MRNQKVLAVGMVITALCVILFGCGAAKNGQTSGVAVAENTVVVQDHKFQPAEITIQKGNSVTWVNRDSVAHTVTGKDFDSGRLNMDQTFQKTFNETGTFEYYCKPHPYMIGKVIVQ